MSTPLILLHGALGSGAQLEGLAEQLSNHRKVYAFTFEGHGGKPSKEPFTMDRFGKQVLAFMEDTGIEKADFFGYSMGGYVALWLARFHPGRVRKIVTLGTKLDWSTEVFEQQKHGLQPDKIAEKVPAFASALQRLHSPLDWQNVVVKTREMMARLAEGEKLAPTDFSAIQHYVLLCVGDRDNMVSQQETEAVAQNLSNGRSEVLPGVAHPIEKLDMKDWAAFLIKHLNKLND